MKRSMLFSLLFHFHLYFEQLIYCVLLLQNGLVPESENVHIAGVGSDLAAEIESIGNEVERGRGIGTERGIEIVTMLIAILETGLAAEKGKGNEIIVNVAVKTGNYLIWN